MTDAPWFITAPVEVGPAGTVTAAIGHGIVAEVDVATGAVVSVAHTAAAPAEPWRPVLESIIRDDAASDAVRRLVFASVFAGEEPQRKADWWLLDRVRARLELEELAPSQLPVAADDVELRRAVEVLTEGLLPDDPLLVQAAVDVVARKTGNKSLRTTSELFDLALAGDGLRAAAAQDDNPRLVILSAGLDLAKHLTSRQLVRGYTELALTFDIPVSDPEIWAGQFDCYLLEPEVEDHPVLQIARLVAVEGGLRATFRLGNDDLRELELVVVPRHGGDASLVKPSATRAIVQAEIRVRTAIRLVHKDVKLRARALQLLREARAVLTSHSRLVPPYYATRLDDLEAAISGNGLRSGLLGDLAG